MALPYAYNSTYTPQQNPQQAAMERRYRTPNQFANPGLVAMGGQDALNGTATQPQSEQPQQQAPAPYAPPVETAPAPVAPVISQADYSAAAQPPTQTTTSSTGRVSARSKTDPKQQGGGGGGNGGGDKNNGGGGNGDGGGGGGDGKGDGKDKGGGGNKKNGHMPWYLQGYGNKAAEGDKEKKSYADIRAFLQTDPAFQQQVQDFIATREDTLGNIQKENQLIRTDFDTNTKYARDERQRNARDLLATMGASGMGRSSAYAEGQGDVEAAFQQAKSDLLSERNYGLQENVTERTNFLNQQRILQDQARADALRRRALESTSLLEI